MNWVAFGTWVIVLHCAALALWLGSLALVRLGRAAPSTVAAVAFFVSVATVVAQKNSPTNEPPRMTPLNGGVGRVELRKDIVPIGGLSMPLRSTGASAFAAALNKIGKINARGAWVDSFRLDFPDGFVFPFGTNHLSFVEVFTQGYVRPRRKSAEAIADIGSRVAIVPGLTELSLEHTLSNSYRIAWTDAAVNRDTNTLMSAAVELFRNGDMAVTTNGVTTLTPRVLPFAHDGFGQDDEWVAANFTNATEILSQGYAQWVDAQVGSGLTNGLYKFTVTISNTPPETVQLVVGECSVAVTNAGEYVFLLEKGTRYTVGFSSLPDGVGYAWDDGEEASKNAPLMLRGAVNSPTYTVRLTSSGDDGSGVEFVEPRQDADGCIVWCPYMTVSPECVDDPAFPVLLVAIVQDLPLGASASVTWRAAGRPLATGDSFLWDGDEEDVDSISIEALFRDVELHGSVSIERHVRRSEIELAGGGLIVLEDGYTNTPNDVVAASSTSVEIRLSWSLAQDGTLSLDSDCAASFSLATEGGSPVALPLEWQGCSDDEDGMTLRATGLGVGSGGTLTFIFTPDESGATLSRTIPLHVVKIRVEAVADWPSNKVRHVFGVNERFRVIADPGGQIHSTNAPLVPGVHNIPTTIAGNSCSISIRAVSPYDDIDFSWLRTMSNVDWMQQGAYVLQDCDGVPGAGFVASFRLNPDYVSFRDIYVMEGVAPMTSRTGCFMDEKNYPAQFYSHGLNAGALRPLNISGFENRIDGEDCVAVQISPPPSSNGGYSVYIPVFWGDTASSCTNRFATVHQHIHAETNGFVRITKEGVFQERNCLNGYSNHN